MSLEWFSRMENVVRTSLPDVCEGFDNYEIIFETDTTEQHPSFFFTVDGDDFCVIQFDPINQEFYSHHFDDEAELHAKVLFSNLDEMLSFIHASFHDYLDEIDEEEFIEPDAIEDDVDENDVDDELYELDYMDGGDPEYDETHIDWITNDKYLHIEDTFGNSNTKHSIYYKLGIVKESGEGVLLRNTVTKQSGDESEERMMLFFKEEEASYILDLLTEYVSQSEGR